MDELKSEIEQRLRDFWQARAIAVSEAPTSTDELGAPLDSITSLEAIMDIDELLNRKLPIYRIIRKGGYESEDDFVSDVTAKVLEVLAEPGHE
jgi:hypothetical protein